MEMPEVHALSFALRYQPPTLVLHYYIGNDKTQEFAHQVKIRIANNVTAAQIVEELQREETVYFNERVVPRKKLERLVQKLIDNKGKKIGKFHLVPKAAPSNISIDEVNGYIAEGRKEKASVRSSESPEESKLMNRKKRCIRERMGLKHIPDIVEDEVKEKEEVVNNEVQDVDEKFARKPLDDYDPNSNLISNFSGR